MRSPRSFASPPLHFPLKLVILLALVLLAIVASPLSGPSAITNAESPGDFNLLNILNSLSSAGNLQALKQFPVPFVVFTRSTSSTCPTTPGFCDSTTAFKAGSPKQIDTDNNGATGQGGHDISVLVEQLLGPPFQLRLTITALPDSKGSIAPDLDVIVAFPMSAFDPTETNLDAPPYLYWGFDTRANAAGQSKAIPTQEQLIFTPNLFGGTVHSIGMTLNSTLTPPNASPDSILFLGGLYQNQLALNPPPPGASILDLINNGLRLTPVPSTATLSLNSSELLGTASNSSQFSLNWTASAQTKAELTFDEGVGSSTSPSATYFDSITVDKMPTNETLSLNLNLGASPPTFSVHHRGNSVINSVIVDRTQHQSLTKEQKFTFTGVPMQVDLSLQANQLSATFGPPSPAQNTPTLGSATIDLSDPAGLFGTPFDQAQAKLVAIPDFSINWMNVTSPTPSVTAGVTKPGDFIGFVGVAMATKTTYPAIWTNNPTVIDAETTLDHVAAVEDDAAGFRWAFGLAKLQDISLNLAALPTAPDAAFVVHLAGPNAMRLHLLIDKNTATVLPHTQSIDIDCTIQDVPQSMTLNSTNFTDQWSYTASDTIDSITCSLTIDTTTCSLTIGQLPKTLTIDYQKDAHFNLTLPPSAILGLYQLICDDTVNGLSGTDGLFGAKLQHAKARLTQVPSFTSSWSYGSSYTVKFDGLGEALGSAEVDGALGGPISIPASVGPSDHFAQLTDQGSSGPVKSFGARVVDLKSLNFSDGSGGGVSFNYQTTTPHALRAFWNTDITSTLTGPNLGMNAELDLLNLPASVDFSTDFATKANLNASDALNEIDLKGDITQPGTPDFVTHVDSFIKGLPGVVTYSLNPAPEGSASLTLASPITEVKVELTSDQGILTGKNKYILADVTNIPNNWSAAWGVSPSPHGSVTTSSGAPTSARVIISRDTKTNTPSKYNAFTAAGGTIQYTPYASTIDARYFNAGPGGSDFTTRLNNLFGSAVSLSSPDGEDHVIYLKNADGDMDFLSVLGTGLSSLTATVNEPNAISGQVNFAGTGPHPFYVGLQTHVSTGASDPDTFTIVNVPNIPSTITLDLDKTSHANVDFSASPGTVTVYSGPLPGANDGQHALKVILTNTPTSVHANWNLGFPGGINVTSSNPVEVALVSQDSSGRNVADFIVQNLSANWGIKTFSPEIDCIDDTPFCTVSIVAIAAFANFNATPGVKGFFVNYTFKSGPGDLSPAGPSPNASEYVPQWTFEAGNFTTINVEAGIKVCIVSDGPPCALGVPVPFISVSVSGFVLDWWADGSIDPFGIFNPVPNWRTNNPQHLIPLAHGFGDHIDPFS